MSFELENIPTMELTMRIPEIRRSVQMFVSSEVDKLKEEIEQKVRSATIQRMDKICQQIDAVTNETIKHCVAEMVNRTVGEIIYSQENLDQIKRIVNKQLKQVLNQAETKNSTI